MKVASAIALLAVFCLGAIVVFPTSALLPETNPNLVVNFVDPGIPGVTLWPGNIDFSKNYVWNGTQFGADVYLENLDAGWALTKANFTLSYNASLTNIVSATLDPAWTGIADTTTPGAIDVKASTSTSPSGDVLILEITFKIQGQHTYPPLPLGYRDFSNLEFSNISLDGEVGPIPTDLVINGVVTVHAVHIHPAYDLRVTGVTWNPPKTVIGQGFTLTINVTGQNWGTENTTFTVTAYANTTPIGSGSISVLGWMGNSSIALITWNTTGFKGKYRISALPTLPEGTTGYTIGLTDGWITVAMIGDITGPTLGVPDGKVDIRDLAAIAKIFGMNWWNPEYDINLDITGTVLGVPDGKIDIKDLALVAKDYGKTDP